PWPHSSFANRSRLISPWPTGRFWSRVVNRVTLTRASSSKHITKQHSTCWCEQASPNDLSPYFLMTAHTGSADELNMQVILTHERTDFDALASLLAASLLYPDALPVLPRRLNRNVSNF